MIRVRGWGFAACLAMLSAPAAQACSFSWGPGWSPEEIKQRSDVRRVKGVFRVVDSEGRAGEDGYLAAGWIYGRIDTLRGTGWDTLQPFDQLWVECGAYRKPTARAKGTFWIARRKKFGRYEMLLWEGEYLPDGQGPTATEKPEKAPTS